MPRGTRLDLGRLLRLWDEGSDVEQIMGILSCGKNVVQARIRQHRGIKQRNRTPLSEEEKAKIVSEYDGGKSGMKIAAELNREYKWVYRFLESVGIDTNGGEKCKRKYPLLQSAFCQAEHDSVAAYWIGFLMADGSVGINKRGQKTITLGLSAVDVDHVRKFAKFLKTTMPVRVEENHGFDGSSLIAVLSVTSSQLYDDLSRYGVVPRKSTKEKVFVLEADRDFWRGMIDGDGWVSFNNGYPGIGLTGSWDAVNQFADYAVSVIGLPRMTVSPNHSIWKVQITGTRGVQLIRRLYEDRGCPFLERKHVIAKECIGWKSSIPDRSEWTIPFLKNLKKDYGTWNKVGEVLGVSGNALGVRFSYLKHKRLKEV